jgi:ribosomal protein S27AE
MGIMAEVVKFKKIWVDADDDSFEAWVIVNRLPRDVFLACKKAGAVWYVDMKKEYGRKSFWGWNVIKAAEVLKKFGYEVDPESLMAARKDEEEKKMLRETVRVASETKIICPKCGEKTSLASYGTRSALFKCYRCDYSAVINADGKIVAQGFDKDFKEFEEVVGKEWTYAVMDAIENPENFNKRLWEREKKKIVTEVREKIKEIVRETGKLETTKFREEDFRKGEGVWYILQDNCILLYLPIFCNSVFRCPRTEQLEALIRFIEKKNRTDEDFRAVLNYL